MSARRRAVLLSLLLIGPVVAGGAGVWLSHPVALPGFSWPLWSTLTAIIVLLTFVVPMVQVPGGVGVGFISNSSMDAFQYAVTAVNPLAGVAAVATGILLHRLVLGGLGYRVLLASRSERMRRLAQEDHRFVTARATGGSWRTMVGIAAFNIGVSSLAQMTGWAYAGRIENALPGTGGYLLGVGAVWACDAVVGSALPVVRSVWIGRVTEKSLSALVRRVAATSGYAQISLAAAVVPAALAVRAYGALGLGSLALVVGQMQYTLRHTVAATERAERARREAEAAYHDGLTGVLNRRGIEREYGRAPLSHIALSDIDRFKAVNDTWGHENGDKVLRAYARVLDAKRRPGLWCGRWGGEEFVVAFVGASDDEVRMALEGIRRECERFEGVLDERTGGRIRFTVSIGWARVQEGESPTEALRRADDALYAAKQGGRNRVVAA